MINQHLYAKTLFLRAILNNALHLLFKLITIFISEFLEVKRSETEYVARSYLS